MRVQAEYICYLVDKTVRDERARGSVVNDPGTGAYGGDDQQDVEDAAKADSGTGL